MITSLPGACAELCDAGRAMNAAQAARNTGSLNLMTSWVVADVVVNIREIFAMRSNAEFASPDRRTLRTPLVRRLQRTVKRILHSPQRPQRATTPCKSKVTQRCRRRFARTKSPHSGSRTEPLALSIPCRFFHPAKSLPPCEYRQISLYR